MRRLLRALLLLLPLGLLAGTCAAQPSAVFIDTRADCHARGGAWLDRDSWQAACQVPWAREECLQRGGAWTPLAAAPAQGVCMGAVSLAARARQCTESGGRWGPPGSAMPWCQEGPPGAQPVRAAPDANKACRHQRECTYGCVYTGPPVAEGAEVTGRCRADNRRAGCYSVVDNARIAGQLCLN